MYHFLKGEAQSTWPQYHDCNPVFEQGFVFTVCNPHFDDLHIRVIDTGHKNAVIGSTTLRTSDIMSSPDMEYTRQPFQLKGGGGNSSIKLAANVRCLQKASVKRKLTDGIQKTPEPMTTQPTSKISQGSMPSGSQMENDKNPKEEENDAPKKAKTPPALDEMVASTISPMIKTTGNSVDPDTFLNNEMELRQRHVSGSPKIKLSLKYLQVILP